MKCGNVSGRHRDKFAALGLTAVPASRAPRTLHHRGRGEFMVAGRTIRLPSRMKSPSVDVAAGPAYAPENEQQRALQIRGKEGKMYHRVRRRSIRVSSRMRAGLGVALAVLLAPVLVWAQSGLRPVVFVHGSSGSAIQFETQAMRFASNGYPQDLLFAFEYDTSISTNGEQIDLHLDAFVDDVLARTGAAQVDVAAHSRGTTHMHRYLSEPQQAAKVAHYVNIDGRTSATPPGGVPTLALWGEWNPTSQIGGAVNLRYPGKAHTELATSAEAFAEMYAFFNDGAPATTDVVPEPPGLVEISGRATIFPVNVGAAGSTLQVFRVDSRTGRRVDAEPLATYAIDAAGRWGPLKVNGRKHYEFALTRTDGSVHHFYYEPFHRSNHFLRLQTSVPNTGLELFTDRSPNHSSLVLLRNREWWGDQPGNNDELTLNGLNIATPLIVPRVGVPAPRGTNLAVFAFDRGSDGVTNLAAGELFPFNTLTFLTAADVFVPTAPAGSIAITMTPRGGQHTVQLNVPNWPSTTDRITVQFHDYVQGAYAFTEYPRGQRR